MHGQLDLLSDSPIARFSDPVSSHEAASHITNTGKRASQQRTVLNMVRAFPGRTSAELADPSTLGRYVVARRLPELRAANLVCNGEKRRCRITNMSAMTWFAV